MKKNPVKNSFLMLTLFIILTGCGLKGNPVPFPAAIPDKKPVIKNMEALLTEETIVLKWNFQDKSGLIDHLDVERSEVGTAGNECKDCPRTFTRVGQVPVKAEGIVDKGQRELNFTDTNVVKGKIYNYRLMLCEENKNCSEASAVEINYK